MNGRRGGGEGRRGSGGCEGWQWFLSVSACVFWFTLYFWPPFIACYLPPPGARPARGRARATPAPAKMSAYCVHAPHCVACTIVRAHSSSTTP